MKKNVGVRGLPVVLMELGETLKELQDLEGRATALSEEAGIDLPSLRTGSAPVKKRTRRKTKPRKAKARKKISGGSESLRVLKIRGRSIGALMGAGYPTFAKLNGASRAKLLAIRGVGKPLVARLERELKKRGMRLKD